MILPTLTEALRGSRGMEPVEKEKNVIQLPVTAFGRGRKEIEPYATVHDLTERQRLEHRRNWLALMVESSTDAIIGKALNGSILSWNAGAERLYGYTAAEAVGSPISLLLAPDRAGEAMQLLEKASGGETIEHHETIHLCKDGRRIGVSLSISPIKDRAGLVIGVSTIARDITERKRADERIRYLALHDTLTGLPNRNLFRERVNNAIARARCNRHLMAVLFIDLDRFKEINDSLGHIVGDRLLQVAANRLQRCLREGDGVARLGGDEFVVDLPVLASREEAMTIAQKILEVLRAPFMIDQYALHISASIGISLCPTDGVDMDVLMRAADSAMYRAKKNGRDNYKFSNEMSALPQSMPFFCHTPA